MKTEKEIREEVRRIEEILQDKTSRGDKYDWDYYTFRKDALLWALGDYEIIGDKNA